jgi:UDP-N-acetylglucosamine 2-epimerase (non-hydrolysing)
VIAVSIVGARPQFVKLAPVDRALRDAGVDHRVIHTGQHHDAELSDAFFDGMELPTPTVNLGIGSASHGAQSGRMLEAVEAALIEIQPDVVVNYGDTNSTLAGGLAAAKLLLPSVHVEAGLRSFDRQMPEEINRIVVDHISTSCLAPTATAMANLEREGLADRAVLVGDVMLDVLCETADAVGDEVGASEHGISGQYVLATVHRPQNTDDPARLSAVVGALASFSVPVLLPVHPRLAERAQRYDIDLSLGALRPVPPLPYRKLVAAMLGARAVVTDSGGLQKEAVHLGVPCTTLRDTTEWTETLAHGMNVLHYETPGLATTALRELPITALLRRDAPDAAATVARHIGKVAEEGKRS